MSSSRLEQWTRALNLAPIENLKASYDELVSKYPLPEEVKEPAPENEGSPKSAVPDCDPLTAMLQEQAKAEEMDKQYRRALRKNKRRGAANNQTLTFDESETIDDTEAMQVVQHDLNRLPPHLHKTKTLEQILFIQQRLNSTIGYRQGMHEIAAYLQTVTTEENPAILYGMLFVILQHISPVYENATPTITNIFEHIQRVDPELAQTMARAECPPQLYTAKWLRLLLSREVEHPDHDVLQVWDFLLQSSNNTTILERLECACAARILLHRDILQTTTTTNLTPILMNFPVETDIMTWMNLTRYILHRDIPNALSLLPAKPIPASPPKQPTIVPAMSSSSSFPQMNNTSSGSNFLSMDSIKKRIEEAKEKTKSFTERISKEWEQKQEQWENHPIQSNYSLDYRNEPIQSYQAAYEERKSDPLAILRAYFVQQEQQYGQVVPGRVWQALADLESAKARK